MAEKVMGWHLDRTYVGRISTLQPWAYWRNAAHETMTAGSDGGFHPSTDIAAAWQVVERSAEVPEVNDFTLTRYYSESRRIYLYTASFFGGSAEAETAPLAICRAALAAVQS